MSRISTPTLESAPAASKPLLDAVHKKLGVVPNLFRVVALSPAALEGFLGLNGALSKTLGRQDARAHRDRGRRSEWLRLLPFGAYLSRPQSREDHTGRRGARAQRLFHRRQSGRGGALRGSGRQDPRRGQRRRHRRGERGGFSDAQIVEIVALVAENVFTNFLNKVAQTDIDFPVLHTAQAA